MNRIPHKHCSLFHPQHTHTPSLTPQSHQKRPQIPTENFPHPALLIPSSQNWLETVPLSWCYGSPAMTSPLPLCHPQSQQRDGSAAQWSGRQIVCQRANVHKCRCPNRNRKKKKTLHCTDNSATMKTAIAMTSKVIRQTVALSTEGWFHICWRCVLEIQAGRYNCTC